MSKVIRPRGAHQPTSDQSAVSDPGGRRCGQRSVQLRSTSTLAIGRRALEFDVKCTGFPEQTGTRPRTARRPPHHGVGRIQPENSWP
jgi:hypothetical protein